MSGGSIREAFKAIDRRRFLPAEVRHAAGLDRPLAIGHGQTNSQPSTVADMLGLLDVEPGQRVLDVGSGSGWTTALLGHLVGPQGMVIGVERVPELVVSGAAALGEHDMAWASIRRATDSVLGWPEQAPYDRILVSAMAHRLASELVEQLVVGGILVCPVAGEMWRIVRTGQDEYERTKHGHYVFVPLICD